MEPKILYNQGANAVFAQSTFIIVGLLLITLGCAIFYRTRRRQGRLGDELKWVLISVGALTGLTLVLFTASALPDMLAQPQVDRGRINRIYQKRLSAGESPITRVLLSSGVDLQVPDALVPDLKAGACVEMTRTAATGYVMIARQLAPDDCLK